MPPLHDLARSSQTGFLPSRKKIYSGWETVLEEDQLLFLPAQTSFSFPLLRSWEEHRATNSGHVSFSYLLHLFRLAGSSKSLRIPLIEWENGATQPPLSCSPSLCLSTGNKVSNIPISRFRRRQGKFPPFSIFRSIDRLFPFKRATILLENLQIWRFVRAIIEKSNRSRITELSNNRSSTDIPNRESMDYKHGKWKQLASPFKNISATMDPPFFRPLLLDHPRVSRRGGGGGGGARDGNTWWSRAKKERRERKGRIASRY